MVEDMGREARKTEDTALRPGAEDIVRRPHRRTACPHVDTIGIRQGVWAA